MPALKTNWVDQVFPYYGLIRILNFYLDLECWIISKGSPFQWNPIRYHNRESWPIEFDDIFGKREERQAFNRIYIHKTLRDGKTYCGTQNGLSSFFVPIVRDGKAIGVLQSGVFLKKSPDKGSLLKQWEKLSEAKPQEFEPDFSRYVTAILKTPLVEAPVYSALKELLEIYAKVTAGEFDREEACQRAESLKNEVFAKYLPHRFWVETAVKNNRVYPPVWWSEKERAEKWRKEEQGINRVPTTIIAFQMEDQGREHQVELESALRNHHFQNELLKFSRSIPNTISSPLENNGVLYFTSSDSNQNETQEKLEILDKIDLVSRFVEHRLNAKVLAGVSRCQHPFGNLSKVFQQAVSSLNYCRPLRRPILFYEDIRTNPTIPEPTNFYALSKAVIEAYTQGRTGEIEAARNQYTKQILAFSAGRVENVKVHFLYTFGNMVDILRRRLPAQDGDLQSLFESFEKRLNTSGTIADLISIFLESLQRLLALSLKPAQTSQTFRFEMVRKYINQNFSQDLKLENVARENGFSISVLGRGFKKITGMGFSAYLRKVRIEKAGELLSSTALPIAQVSQECGFNNLQYFFDVFKRSTGKTPQEFRNAPKAASLSH